MARFAAIPERRASFRETRTFAALDQPLESTGTLLYRRPAYLEKDTDWPQRERLVVDGMRLTETLGDAPPRVLDLGSRPQVATLVEAIRGPLSGDLGALRRVFDVRLAGTWGGWTLDLLPRGEAARLLRSVRLEGAGTVVRRFLLTQPNGDAQQMLIAPAA